MRLDVVSRARADLTEDEGALIDSAVRGNVDAYERLYRQHAGRVYGLCLRMLAGDVHAAEDCTQETFVQAWYKLDRFQRRSSLSTWLHRIAVNAVLGRHRKERNLEYGDGGREETTMADPTIDSGIDLEEAIRQLPQGARQVLVLCGVYGYSHQEASEQLGIATGTCKAQLHRARKLLRERLGD